MFRDLIPQLAEQFHVVAPDLPRFGQSDMSSQDKFNYTFDNISHVIDRFLQDRRPEPLCDLHIRLWRGDGL